MNIKHIYEQSSNILQSNFGIIPQASTYALHSSDWDRFCLETNSYHSEGVFFPRSLTAHVNLSSDFFPVTFLHEFFGHGLFYEYALAGQTIVSLENDLVRLEDKIRSFEGLDFSSGFTVDDTNPYFQEYSSLRTAAKQYFNRHNRLNEGFAMWLEHYLADSVGVGDLFEKKMELIVSSDYNRLFEQFKSFEDDFGSFALIAQSGFPKYYDANTLVDTLKKLYGAKVDSIDLGILYGSQKPYSDIDLFIVSDTIQSSYNHWIDIYAVTPERLKWDMTHLSIAITDPLFSGTPFIGSSDYLQFLQRELLSQPITSEAIAYNHSQSERQRQRSLQYPEGSRNRLLGESYSWSFKRNAEELEKGNKPLTLTNLK